MKRKSYFKKPDPLKSLLTKAERSIVTLDRKCGDFKNPEHNEQARHLLKVYTLRGTLSNEQWRLVRELNQRPSRRKINREVYLYAMASGNDIKIGLSANPEARKRDMQTGNAKEIQLLWRMGPIDRKEAHRLEKKLHRRCKRFNLRGEWFTSACMDTVLRFEPNRPAINYMELL